LDIYGEECRNRWNFPRFRQFGILLDNTGEFSKKLRNTERLLGDRVLSSPEFQKFGSIGLLKFKTLFSSHREAVWGRSSYFFRKETRDGC